jgi:hypothetical protein
MPETFEGPTRPDEDTDGEEQEASRLRSMRKWIVIGVALVFFGYLMTIVVNPYEGERFEKVPHGDHVHYVPKDRNEDVPIGEFPTEKPGPDEDILPDGQVVQIER